MPTPRTKANRKYNEKAYDRVALTVPKGKKEVIADCAKEQEKSLNGYINEAIDEKMERDNHK